MSFCLSRSLTNRNGKASHSAWCNYDDLNEYFWSLDCFSLGWPIGDDGDFFKSTSDLTQLDKTSLLAEVITHLKELKTNAAQASEGLIIPKDNDEIKS
ncbi:1,3-beta-glucan synthase subunit FKS1 domain 1 protein [Medicago truncatula]|uniref:1,3-beta-glucan synthase subunit FKS1 domain 1 protein n=1 Tax=Medicago truncatula TaxID=3880 RepID=Q2HTQ6_MEDTR|nr:hypothetical protein MtrDRAFT_AC150207g15v2 [Medicago truncatula]AES59382.1 1,3-beta-glucan synthase subunit FKS1 domain 1 protein [Medicago truncatula]